MRPLLETRPFISNKAQTCRAGCRRSNPCGWTALPISVSVQALLRQERGFAPQGRRFVSLSLFNQQTTITRRHLSRQSQRLRT
jgi:hypothetical protein